MNRTLSLELKARIEKAVYEIRRDEKLQELLELLINKYGNKRLGFDEQLFIIRHNRGTMLKLDNLGLIHHHKDWTVEVNDTGKWILKTISSSSNFYI